MSAENFIETAKGYLAALQAVVDNLPRDKNIVHPIGLLASQAIELSLKGYLLKKGWDTATIRKELGHNLEKAWNAASKNGLKLHFDHAFTVSVLNISHDKPYLFRYPEDGVAAGIPEPKVLCDDVATIIDAVEKG